jgi:hypothetical protein
MAVKEFGYHITPVDVIENIPKVFRRFINVDSIINASIHISAQKLLK